MRALVFLVSILTVFLSFFAGADFVDAPEISPTCTIELAKLKDENRENVQDFFASVSVDHAMQMLSIRRVAISDGSLNVQREVDLRIFEMLSLMMDKKSISAREAEYLKYLKEYFDTYPLAVEETQSNEITKKFLTLGL